MSPRVTVGLPVRNGEQYLDETLASLRRQTFRDFELIVGDNASTDRTREIVLRHAGPDRRIRYFRHPTNLGAARNYNEVFRRARGELFKWSADDDPCLPELLERCVRALDARPEAVLCFPRTRLIDANGEPVAHREIDLVPDSPDPAVRLRNWLSSTPLTHNPVFGLIRTEVLARTRLIGSYLASDRCLVAELSLHGPFVELPEPLLLRRKHARNVGTSREDLAFYAPRLARRVVLPEMRVLREHLVSIERAPLPAATRLRLAGLVAGWAVSRLRGFRYEITRAIETLVGAGEPRPKGACR